MLTFHYECGITTKRFCDLGVTFDQRLTFSYQTNKILAKVDNMLEFSS
jgi:hypothetical protein